MSTMLMRAVTDGDVTRLTSPAVGLFTCAVPAGRALIAGESAGILITLGRQMTLLVPDGVSGIVRNPAPELVHAPVGFGSVLYELGVLQDSGLAERSAVPDATSTNGHSVFRSPSAGRFWHRAVPNEPPLISAGDVLEQGRAIGLIEVMKTFTLVHYAPGAGLPPRARVVRVLASDGAEVAEKAALVELEAI